MREWSDHLLRNSNLTAAEKKKAMLGNLAFDGMTIRHGLRWHNSTGCFAGLADEVSDRAGTTPQKMFLAQAVKLAEQAAAAAGPDGGDSAAAAAAAAPAPARQQQPQQHHHHQQHPPTPP